MNSLNPDHGWRARRRPPRARRGAWSLAGRGRAPVRRGAATSVAYALGFAEWGAGLRASSRASPLSAPSSRARSGSPSPRTGAAEQAVADSRGAVLTVSDDEVVEAWRDLARLEGVFCEPASGAGLAALAQADLQPGAVVVCVITGHGLKDPEAVERLAPEPSRWSPRPMRSRRPSRDHSRPLHRPRPRTSGRGSIVAVALDLWNEVEVTEGGEGPADLGHLGVRAFARVSDPDGLDVHLDRGFRARGARVERFRDRARARGRHAGRGPRARPRGAPRGRDEARGPLATTLRRRSPAASA